MTYIEQRATEDAQQLLLEAMVETPFTDGYMILRRAAWYLSTRESK